MNPDFIKFYSRKDIQRELVFNAKNRELVVKFGDNGYGKRPDVLQYENDVLELAKQGVTSFHISEEHWVDPLRLKAGMAKKELDEIRTGFDLILDIDCPIFEYSKLTTYYLIEALKFLDIKNISVKFSGNKGFHIAIPFKAFPKIVNRTETRLLFPDASRTIAEYLENMTRDHLADGILEKESIKEVADKVNKNVEQIAKDGKFDPFSIIDIDTILISNRHTYRAPYSYHEKSELISIPIEINSVLKFDKNDATPKNVEVKLRYLDDSEVKEGEATNLLMQALDWKLRKSSVKVEHKSFPALKKAANPDFFPPCIKICLNGIKSDGRKRALFALINYFRNTGYDMEQVQDIIEQWNKKNYLPLAMNYIQSQISWHKKQNSSILPPNCPHASENQFYKEIDICYPDNMCKLIKNPVNYTTRRLSFIKEGKTKGKGGHSKFYKDEA